MNIEITSRNFKSSDNLLLLIKNKIKKIEKFGMKIINCHIILNKINNDENIELIVKVRNYEFISNSTSNSFEISLKEAIAKVITQIKKQHSKDIGR